MTAKAVVFDMDGVLFDTERISRNSWIEVGKRWGLDGIEIIYPKVIGVNHTDGLQIVKDAYGQDFDAETFTKECAAVMKRMLQEEGLPIKKGVREILEALKQKKIPVGICSSTRTGVIRDHLQKTGLSDYFERIIGGDQILHSKPKPDIYLKACDALEMNPEDCIAVEDSPNGIRSAHAAGLIPVMIPDLVEPTDEMRRLSHVILHDLSDLQSMIENKEI
ncbi:MAG: HAD family phosphatase [Firmicutes bacterium]|nr:HAD family phosphatase [Bacillota bacterium]